MLCSTKFTLPAVFDISRSRRRCCILYLGSTHAVFLLEFGRNGSLRAREHLYAYRNVDHTCTTWVKRVFRVTFH